MYFMLLLSLGFSALLQAQSAVSLEVEEKEKDSTWSVSPVFGMKKYKNLEIYEVGVQVAKTITENSRVRLDLMYRQNGSEFEQSWGQYNLDNDSDISSVMVGASYEYFPFREVASPFLQGLKAVKFRAGVFYVANPTYGFTSTVNENEVLAWGDLAFTTDQIGALNTEITTNKVQPFLSLGYDNFFQSKYFNLVVETGVNYHGSPQVTMTGTNLIAPTVDQAAVLEENLKQNAYMPFLQIAFQIKL